MSNFTRNVPDEKTFYKGLVAYLTSKKYTDLVDIIKGCKIVISATQAYSYRRWDAWYTTIVFSVSEENLGKVNDIMKHELESACDLLIPDEAGLDVMAVEFVLNMDEASLVNDLNEISEHLLNIGKSSTLPNDILLKAEEMSEAYLYMFSIENYIRLFIDKVASDLYGANYFNDLNLPKSIKDSVALRKRQETQNQWLSVRGDSLLFYLDFKDLSFLITNNWDIFKLYFPNQAWVTSKIDELGHCRNLIAHNSYLGAHERDIIRITFHSFIRQISIKKAG